MDEKKSVSTSADVSVRDPGLTCLAPLGRRYTARTRCPGRRHRQEVKRGMRLCPPGLRPCQRATLRSIKLCSLFPARDHLHLRTTVCLCLLSAFTPRMPAAAIEARRDGHKARGPTWARKAHPGARASLSLGWPCCVRRRPLRRRLCSSTIALDVRLVASVCGLLSARLETNHSPLATTRANEPEPLAPSALLNLPSLRSSCSTSFALQTERCHVQARVRAP